MTANLSQLTHEATAGAVDKSTRRRWLLVWAVLIVQSVIIAFVVIRPAIAGQHPSLNPAPDPAEQARDAARVPVVPAGFVGARITASHNQDTTKAPIAFDTVRWDTGFWDPSTPTRLTFPEDGICRVEAQITTLGTSYGHAPNTDVSVLVIRDGDPHAFVAFARVHGQSPALAGGINAATTDWFEEGEYLEVLVTPGLTVESNWPGRANVSPVLTVVC